VARPSWPGIIEKVHDALFTVRQALRRWRISRRQPPPIDRCDLERSLIVLRVCLLQAQRPAHAGDPIPRLSL
jgi:hypothetical protein